MPAEAKAEAGAVSGRELEHMAARGEGRVLPGNTLSVPLRGAQKLLCLIPAACSVCDLWTTFAAPACCVAAAATAHAQHGGPYGQWPCAHTGSCAGGLLSLKD